MARKNTQKAVEAWIKGKTYHAKGRNGSPIWTAGGKLYSYSTEIGKWSDADGNMAIVNTDRYSVTTTCQQRGVMSELLKHGKRLLAIGDAGVYAYTERG